jgi:hypothetical protein
MPARGPLCLEQKQRLVKLKQEVYTCDEIVIKFPGRKRRWLRTLIAILVRPLMKPYLLLPSKASPQPQLYPTPSYPSLSVCLSARPSGGDDE